jgi:deoxyribose-phosphate aldolase
MALRFEELSKTIDHTLLDPEATADEVEATCTRARELHVASVCLLPAHVPAAAQELRGSDVKVCAVVGLPSGRARGRTKIAQAKRALAAGAGELEFVVNVGALRGGDARLVHEELVSFARAVRMSGTNAGGGSVLLKAILETSQLDDKLTKLAAKIVELAGLDFAQTSSGLHPDAATVRDVELLRECLPEAVGVKACGGIETLADVEAMVNAGAGRIGSATAVEILASPVGLVPAS